jgi:hypothetical protein
MLKRIGSMIVLGLCVFVPRAATQQVPVSVLLENVRDPANYVAKFVKDTTIRPSYADAVFERARQAIEAVDKALAAGVPETRTVSIKFEGEHYDEIEKPMTLAEIKAMCERMAKVSGQAYTLRQATQMATNASGWPKRLSEGPLSEVNARVAADAGRQCVKAIDDALTSNNPGTTQIKLIGDSKMTLAEAKEMCVYVLGEADKQHKARFAAQEAEYEPFRKLLSSDKLRIYNDRLKSYKVYGAGGRVLRTPEDYRDSAVWCTTGVDRGGIVPVWSVDCWHFRGMTMLGSVVSRTGTGDQAPSSAFRCPELRRG